MRQEIADAIERGVRELNDGEQRTEFGGFVTAVVDCDWAAAVRRADAENRRDFADIVEYRLALPKPQLVGRCANCGERQSDHTWDPVVGWLCDEAGGAGEVFVMAQPRKVDLVTWEEDDLANMDPAWQGIAGGEVKVGTFAGFDFAEETIGMLQLDNGQYVVGIGESMRPYREIYRGPSGADALTTFLETVRIHSIEL